MGVGKWYDISIFVNAPAECQDTHEQYDSTDGDQTGVECWKARRLLEVNEAVQYGDNVVDTEDEGVKDRGRAEFETAVEVVELGESEEDQAQENRPRLPAVELIMMVGNRPHEELDS